MVPARPSFRPIRLRPRRRRHVRRASGLRQLQRELRRWRRRPVLAAARTASALALGIATAALSPAAVAGARARQADPPAPTYSPPVSFAR